MSHKKSAKYTEKQARERAAKRREAQRAQQRMKLRDTAKNILAKGNVEGAFEMLFGVIEALQDDNDRMAARITAAIRARFGRRSEKLSAEEIGQLVLALGGTEEDAAASEPNIPAPDAPPPDESSDDVPSEKKKRPNHHGRSPIDPALPRDIVEVSVPDDERACIHCATTMTEIGYVEHEVVEFVPAKLIVRVERREKLACKACKQDITTAPRSMKNELRVGPSLLAHLLESKCDDALPIYRQQDQLRRLGFDVPLNTLYGYWNHATSLLTPLAEIILSHVLGEPIVGIDDTRLDYLDPDDPRGKQRGHLWCFVGNGPLVAFTFTKTWEAEGIEPWIAAIDGYIQCDDYKGYGSTITDPDGRTRILVPKERRLGCMMHVRRRFHEALVGGDARAAAPLKMIADIYRVEAEAADFSPVERLDLRTKQSLPILEAFDLWVDQHAPKLRPKSPLFSAVRYAIEQRSFVNRFFTDGRFAIDNGRVERQIKEPVIGRKNFLFAGSAEAAERLAVAYTVVLSARHAGVPVREYLIDVMTKIADGFPVRRVAELLPSAWLAERTTVNQAA